MERVDWGFCKRQSHHREWLLRTQRVNTLQETQLLLRAGVLCPGIQGPQLCPWQLTKCFSCSAELHHTHIKGKKKKKYLLYPKWYTFILKRQERCWSSSINYCRSHTLRQSPGEGNGNPLQYSCLEKTMGRGAWQATVHEVTKSQTRLSN